MRDSILNNTLNHFQTFVWLRWRIRTNQLRHGSSLGRALAAILLVSFAVVAVGLFVIGGILGAMVPRFVPRENYFLLWDGFIAAFCFIWVIHVATDIQRSDAITFDRILHLPVAFAQAFALNYLSTMMSMTLLSLCAFCLGFTFGSCFSIGPIALLFLIPFAVFLVAITALTYQLQGWLAAIMSNPRRRQMVMIALPLCIVLISQIPAFFATRFAKNGSVRARARELSAPPTSASPAVLPQVISAVPSDSKNEGQIEVEPPPLSNSRLESISEGFDQAGSTKDLDGMEEEARKASDYRLKKEQRELASAATNSLWIGRFRQLNLLLPPLWMAGCVESIMSGTLHVFWLTGAMAFVGFISLQRNYRQTIRFYQGQSDSRATEPRALAAVVGKKGRPTRLSPAAPFRAEKSVLLVERRIPFVSEETAAIITMTLQSMTRAPEVKLYLLLPLIAPFILFGVLQSWQIPKIDELKAAVIIGFTSCSLFITSGMLGNYFAYDRAGFRAFVLSPIRRERILLGRNLVTAPFLLLQTFLLALTIGIYFGMAIDKMLCSLILSASILPLYGLLTNLMSILTPFPLAAGSIQPKQFNLVPTLFSLVLSMIMPAITVLALLPLGLEWVIDRFIPSTGVFPFAFVLSILWLTGSIAIYRWLLPWEGKLLANREKELLRVVTSKIE